MSKGSGGGGASVSTGGGGSTPVREAGGVQWVKTSGAVGNGDVAVKVSVEKFEKAWQKDDQHVGPKGDNQGAQKLENAKAFLNNPKIGPSDNKKTVPVEMPRATFNAKTGTASITDGRHRAAAAREQGRKAIYITVPKSQAESVKKHLGA